LDDLILTRRPPRSDRLRTCVALICATALSSCIGCRRETDPSESISIEESITPQPIRVGNEVITFRLAKHDGSPLSGARVQLEGDMNHPGMAPVFNDAIEISPGNYRGLLNFTMGGDWVVLFHISLADGRKMEKQMDVKGVESR
jgi:YtkA-like